MNYDIKCSKCPPLADTHAWSRWWQSFTVLTMWLSPVRQTKLTKVHFKTRELVLASVAGFVKTPALLPNLIIQWIEFGWIGATHHQRWSQGNLTCWNSKLETVKTISTPRKINAIWLIIKINQPTLVGVCGYTLAINWQNFTEIYLA